MFFAVLGGKEVRGEERRGEEKTKSSWCRGGGHVRDRVVYVVLSRAKGSKRKKVQIGEVGDTNKGYHGNLGHPKHRWEVEEFKARSRWVR